MTALKVKVTPGSSRNKILGWIKDELKVAVQAPPEKGKANKALLKFLGKSLGVATTSIQITSGETGARKTLAIELDKKKIDEKLSQLIG